jgi:hypothetical protein
LVAASAQPPRAYGDGTLWAYGHEATFTSWLDPRTGAHHPPAMQHVVAQAKQLREPLAHHTGRLRLVE